MRKLKHSVTTAQRRKILHETASGKVIAELERAGYLGLTGSGSLLTSETKAPTARTLPAVDTLIEANKDLDLLRLPIGATDSATRQRP